MPPLIEPHVRESSKGITLIELREELMSSWAH